MPAPAIRLDDVARSRAAQIYIRGAQQRQLPGIWEHDCSRKKISLHAAWT
jgi:hypothetical protein